MVFRAFILLHFLKFSSNFELKYSKIDRSAN